VTLDLTRETHAAIEGVDSALRYYRAIDRAFAEAVRAAGGPIERAYRIGGHAVRLRFAGPALVPRLTPALEHLRDEFSEVAALTVGLWDTASTGTRMPSPPWSPDDLLPRSEVRGFSTAQVRTAYDPASGTVTMLNCERSSGMFWARSARDVAYYESGAPLRALFHWWMSARELQCVHAAAVGDGRGAVLLVGRGGAGKSSTALACLEAGLTYLGDDYCLLQTSGRPYVHSLYSSAKVSPQDLWRVPPLAPLVSNADRMDTEKALLFLHQHRGSQIATGLPLKAVLVIRVTGGEETRLVRASGAAALFGLAPSTLFQLQPSGAAALTSMATAVREVPCYYLDVGTVRAKIPHVVLGALRET
jgi:hypothetical protein